ncbi:MAG: 4Fe-4S binding protein [Gracilibacteraceae bacterium]|nr:4Fe-4S binding protein [Gracilibacteraceae bacterium]
MIAGQVYGRVTQGMDPDDVLSLYSQLIPEAASFNQMTGMTAQALDANAALIAYVGISSHNGYGGPMLVGTIVEPSGKLREPVILSHNETSSFLSRVTGGRYFTQFKDKPVDSIFMLGEDIDAASGATLSSRAVSDGVRESANSIARAAFALNPQQAEIRWQFGPQEIAVALFFAAGFVIYKVKRLRKYRLALLGASVVFLGFWLNRALSVIQFSSILLGYFPSPKTNLLFYILTAGALAPIIFCGKNLYCAFICPFCGLQELANKISGKNIPLTGKMRKWLGILRNALLFFILLCAFVTGRAAAVTYEPFGVAFGLDLKADGYLWYILFAFLALSFFFRRLWCAGFCPAGAMLDFLRMLMIALRKKFALILAFTKRGFRNYS